MTSTEMTRKEGPLMMHPSETGHPAAVDPQTPLVVPDEPHVMTWAELPEGVRSGLSSIPVEEWHNVIAVHCTSDFAKMAIRLVSIFDRYWVKSRRAEDFVQDRMTGTEREKYRERADLAFKEIAAVTIEMGGRAKLVEDLQEDRKFLVQLAMET